MSDDQDRITRLCSGLETSPRDPSKDSTTWPHLADALRACEPIERANADADSEANHCQRQHRDLTIIAAAAGTFAVVIAILQLTELRNGFSSMPVIEGLSALIAVAAVAAGLWSKRQPGWWIARYRAERYRFLKFRFLIDPVVWGGTPVQRTHRVDRLRQDAEAIPRVDRRGLKKWAEQGMVPEAPAYSASWQVAPHTLAELIDYYLRERLCDQMMWFNERAHQLSDRDRVLKRLPPWLFFGSVCAALVHFTFDLVFVGREPAQVSIEGIAIGMSVALILVAAILPVLGGGVRTLRSAYQFARNKSRYKAALEGLRPWFELLNEESRKLRASRAHKVSMSSIFYHMWWCEQILEAEHREWLRLMMQAEWFG